MEIHVPIAAIICTHNPRADYLARVLDALRNQTLSKSQWELLVVDNASAEVLASNWDLAWHPHARHIREDELGVAAARLRGIRESTGELVVFVDDDNVLALDYLERALEISREFPQIGAFGCSLSAEFEAEPPDWLIPYLPGLGVEQVTRDHWCNEYVWSEASPYGAGMCVRRIVVDAYKTWITNNPVSKLLGRRGSAMWAGEDTDIAWTAIDLGFGTGRFKKLRVLHLIRKARLNERYIIDLYAGFAFSNVLLRAARNLQSPDHKESLLAATRFWLSICRGTPLQRRIDLASRRSTRAAYSLLKKL